jgi:hypothetical protein
MRRWLVVLLVLAGYGYFFLFPEKALLIVDKLALSDQSFTAASRERQVDDPATDARAAVVARYRSGLNARQAPCHVLTAVIPAGFANPTPFGPGAIIRAPAGTASRECQARCATSRRMESTRECHQASRQQSRLSRQARSSRRAGRSAPARMHGRRAKPHGPD